MFSQWKHGWFCFGFIDKQGQPPTPRSRHASAILGNNGYISGGVVSVFTQFSTAYSQKNCWQTCLDDAAIQLFACTSAGRCSAGFVLLGPGDLDLDRTVTLFHTLVTVSLLFLTLICFLYVSDLPYSSAPPGRSMFSMTPTSDHTLFIFGGADTDRNTLSKSDVFVWFFYVSMWLFSWLFSGGLVSRWVWLRPLSSWSLIHQEIKPSLKQSRSRNPFKLCLMFSKRLANFQS